MNAVQLLFRFLVLIGVAALLQACKKDVPLPLTNGVSTVTFKLSGFESQIKPLAALSSTYRRAAPRFAQPIQAVGNAQTSDSPQYLYFWSFNEESLDPDIAIDAAAGVTFDAAAAEPGFVNGFAVDPFEAGRALSVTGARSLEISLPLHRVEAVSELAFGMNSSGTGPKDFSITYSIDGGTTYETLSEHNPFEHVGTSSWNRYAFDLRSISGVSGAEVLKFRLEFKAGDREGAGEYDENRGTVRLDNVRLSGVYSGEGGNGDPSLPNRLHYYIFSATDGALVSERDVELGGLAEGYALEAKLEAGIYEVLFVAYRSDKGVFLPQTLHNASEFYFGQAFDDINAITYACVLQDFEVGAADMEQTIVLNRCYSSVEFDFTDLAEDLLSVKKIVITKGHDNYLYTPFGQPEGLPVSDIQSMIFSDFSQVADYRISFNQFLGLLDGTRNVTYEVTAYDQNENILNALTLSEDITNNVRLLFTGRLLGNTGTVNGFLIDFNTDWNQVREHEF